MNIQKIHVIFASTIFLVFVLFQIFFDKYEYRDYVIKNCESGKIYFDAKLMGSFSNESPLIRERPYYFRLEVKSSNNKELQDIRPDDLYLEMDNTSERFPIALSKEVVSDSEIFLAENIDIPYQEYILRGTFFLKNETGPEIRAPLKCSIERKPSSEYRITLVDNLLSV